MGKFDHAAEEIKAAASISLGCVTVGNLAKVPPVLIRVLIVAVRVLIFALGS